MRDPVVSVVVPTYESAADLPRTLRSIMTQTVDSRDFEVIVVDDGSTDDVERAVSPFAHFIRLFRTEHSGIAAAQNTGILASNGRFVAFLDPGDEWFSERLQAMLVLAATEKNSVIGTDYVRGSAGKRGQIGYYASGNLLGFFERSAREQYVLALNENIISENWLSYMQLVPRRILARVGAFDSTLAYGAHYDLWLRILEAGFPMRVVPKPLAVCRGLETRTVTSHRFLRSAEDRVRILQRRRQDISEWKWHEATGRLSYLRLQEALQSRRYGSAMQDALRLLRNIPYLSKWAFNRIKIAPQRVLLPRQP